MPALMHLFIELLTLVPADAPAAGVGRAVLLLAGLAVVALLHVVGLQGLKDAGVVSA